MRPQAHGALPPAWFRFTDPEDQGKYGENWYRYDESAIMRKRGRDLVALENDLGMPLVSALNGFRESSTLGDLAATWLALREVDPARAGDFDEYNPITTLLEWTAASPEPEGKAEDPALTPERPESDSTTAASSPNTTSEKTDTVVLPSMPIAE